MNKTVGSPNLSLYEAVRYLWKVSREIAWAADFVLAVRYGHILGVFEPEEWMPANKVNSPDISDAPGIWESQKGRSGFRGREAPDDIQKLYRGKRLPDEYRHRQNPIRYVNLQ